MTTPSTQSAFGLARSPSSALAPRRLLRPLVALALAASTLSAAGCFPLAVTGAAVGTLAAIDRRTVGAQAEDQSIELKAGNQLRSTPGFTSGISVTSYNRKVLLTGQVPDQATRQRAEQIVAGIENVRSIHNELQVAGQVGIGTASNDALITGKVKAAFVDAVELQANTIKVLTENGVVYLMGLLTQREAERAAQVASRVGGVQRVVTVFEIISAEELARIERAARESQSAQPGAQPAGGSR